MQPRYIHLRLHTEYSLIDGLPTVEGVMQACTSSKMPAIAVTDQSNLFATVKFYKVAMAAGIKPIIGADLWLHHATHPKEPFKITFLCLTPLGYKRLSELISRAYLQGQADGLPVIQKEWLTPESTVDLIALCSRESDLAAHLFSEKKELAQTCLQEWINIFPDRFYLEVQRTGRAQEEFYNQAVIELAHEKQIPLVATNDVRFLSKEDFEAHEARVCIQDGYVLNDPKRPQRYNSNQYFRTPEEMEILFSDIPEALANTVEIAKRCNVNLTLNKTFLPQFPIPGGLNAENYLTQQASEGLLKRFSKNKSEEELKPYTERLHIELKVINDMGFAGYFLIVADFISWAKNNGIPVGPGRGSGAGSLVAYVLGITDLDPLQYDLLFERFLNPERVSMPDFDIDFCMDGRDRVIEYVADHYGRDAVAQIITYGSMAARAVMRDVGRVLGYPYGMVDKLAKLIPQELGITLEKALEQEDELRKRFEEEDEVKVLMELALKLEGLARNAGKHAGGVVIAPSKLTDFAPLYCEAGGDNLVTQFDKDDIEAVGLVKFDFLGLRTLTIIDWAIDTINTKRKKNNEEPLDLTTIPLNDSKTFDLLKACQTSAVFQLESRGMKDLIKRLQPDCFEEIIALVALFRPGPLQSGMVDDFINRKHKRAKMDFFHPSLEPILRPTYGIILYQEQVMQIAQVLAAYTLGAADLLRRAMGKKKAEEMAQQREIFIEGSGKQGVDKKLAEHIFDLMEKFAGYGFNKSHSAAYALITYQTAWLKTHYPAEFMAAVLSSDMDNTDKVVGFLEECKSLKLKVLPPDVNSSQYKFTVSENGEIIYGLGAIKGAGQAAIEIILERRLRCGTFKNLFDFCEELDTQKVNRRVLEALIRSGGFDKLGANRASLLANLDGALQAAEQKSDNEASGQQDLFGSVPEQQLPVMLTREEFSMELLLTGEKETLGFYLSGHPLQRYEKELKKIVVAPLIELNNHRNKTVVLAGWVVGLRLLFTKRGDRMAIVTLEDQSARVDLAVFSEAYGLYKDFINKDKLLIVEGEVTIDEFTGNNKIMARRLFDITNARENFARGLLLKVNDQQVSPDFLENLQKTLKPFSPGKFPLFIDYQRADSTARLTLDVKWHVTPRDELLNEAKKMLGDEAVVVCY